MCWADEGVLSALMRSRGAGRPAQASTGCCTSHMLSAVLPCLPPCPCLCADCRPGGRVMVWPALRQQDQQDLLQHRCRLPGSRCLPPSQACTSTMATAAQTMVAAAGSSTRRSRALQAWLETSQPWQVPCRACGACMAQRTLLLPAATAGAVAHTCTPSPRQLQLVLLQTRSSRA